VLGCQTRYPRWKALRKPVWDMYLGYWENKHHYGWSSMPHRGYYHNDNVDEVRSDASRDFSGQLEISAADLTIWYRNGLVVTEQRANAFTSIAVRVTLNTCAAAGYEYAVLPLIADSSGSDTALLFHDMDAGDRAKLDEAGDHALVSAVVTCATDMRMECHGFMCETEDDAALLIWWPTYKGPS